MGTGTGVETSRRTQDGNEDGSADRNESKSGDRNGTRMGAGKGTRIGSRRVQERRRSGRNRTRVVDVMWETGETWVGEKRGKRRKERVGPVAANPDDLENNKEAGEEHKVLRA